MAIKLYETEAAYEAAAKSTIESSISLIETNNEIKADGVNVLTKSPVKGDIVALNEKNEVVYITLESFTTGTFPSAWTKVGVVVMRRGKEVIIVDKANASYKWSDIYSLKLTGFTLDGTDRTGTLGVNDASAWGTYNNYVIPYNATTIEDFIAQLNAFFAANEPFATQNWQAKDNGDGSVSLIYLFSDYRQYANKGSAGFTVEGNLFPESKALASIRRKNGYRGAEGAVSSYYKALQYLRSDNSSTTYNPNTRVSSIRRAYPICLPSFLGTSQYQTDKCALLREHYGEGEEGWKRFMRDCMPVNPSLTGNMAQRDGLERTRQLAAYTYVAKDGSVKPASPAANYVQSKNYECDGLRKGDWYLPTVEDLTNILQDIQYAAETSDRNTDRVNKALYKIGGNAISNASYLWSACRYGAYGAWSSYGGSGYFGGGSMYAACGCLALARLALK